MISTWIPIHTYSHVSHNGDRLSKHHRYAPEQWAECRELEEVIWSFGKGWSVGFALRKPWNGVPQTRGTKLIRRLD